MSPREISVYAHAQKDSPARIDTRTLRVLFMRAQKHAQRSFCAKYKTRTKPVPPPPMAPVARARPSYQMSTVELSPLKVAGPFVGGFSPFLSVKSIPISKLWYGK
jgi:hypothetical protein